MKFILALIIFFTTSTCIFGSDDEIIGTWEGKNPIDGVLIFREDFSFELKEKIEDPKSDMGNVEWYTNTEVKPNQLYLRININGEIKGRPMGIFKIKKKWLLGKDELIIKSPKTYNKSLGGFDMGFSRYEMPKDFSGFISVYLKID
jgi:hypothetical protein